MKKIMGVVVCMLVMATAVPAVSAVTVLHPFLAASSRIGVKLVATVTEVDDDWGLLGGVIHVGDVITGKYTYVTGVPDMEPNPEMGYYYFTFRPCGFEVKAGGLVFKTDPRNIQFEIGVYNDFDEYGNQPLDALQLASDMNRALSNGMTVDEILWVLIDPSATAIANTDLPTTAPVLADWPSGPGLVLGGKDPSDAQKQYTVTAHVTVATTTQAVSSVGISGDLGTPSVALPHASTLPFKPVWIKVLFERFPHAFPLLRHLLGY